MTPKGQKITSSKEMKLGEYKKEDIRGWREKKDYTPLNFYLIYFPWQEKNA